MEPSTPRRKRLTRDQRVEILLMRRLKYKYSEIAKFLEVSERSVEYTCTAQKATPQHHKAGRPPKLQKDEVDRLEEFVISSKETRRMSYAQILDTLFPENDVGIESIKNALRERGYRRRVALRKPPISETNRLARLQWAIEHLH